MGFDAATYSLGAPQSESRASYYDAAVRLRYADYRTGSGGDLTNYRAAFEEHRYDALGRRVLVRTTTSCRGQLVAVAPLPGPDGQQQTGSVDLSAACNVSTVRRTIWDGEQELWEIQQPGGPTESAAALENDTAPVRSGHANPDSGSPLSLYPYFGAVSYTVGLELDQPVAVTRINAVFPPSSDVHGAAMETGAVTFYPLYSHTGQPYAATFADGLASRCEVGSDGLSRCQTPLNDFRAAFLPWKQGQYVETGFLGTLLADKQDKTATYYRRNRAYDPVTGQFTQEDPLGLAGGSMCTGTPMAILYRIRIHSASRSVRLIVCLQAALLHCWA